MSPVGTPVDAMQGQPPIPFTPDLGMFEKLTERQHMRALSFVDPGDVGGVVPKELPAAGVIAWLHVVFDGTIDTVEGAGTIATTDRYPHGLLDGFEMNINAANGLISCSGEDLFVRRYLTNPAYVEGTDVFPGTLGGGDANLGDITDGQLYLTWDVPVVLDMTTLIGLVYAQSSQSEVHVRPRRAATTEVLTAAGGATATIDGDWSISVTSFSIPRGPEGQVIIPPMDRRHGFQAFDRVFSATGDVPVPLPKLNGQALRLLLQVRAGDGDIIQPTPDDGRLTKLAIRYGGNKKPQEFEPASVLTAINNNHYGSPLPYGYLALDFLRDNPARDHINMPGVTELEIVPTISAGTALGTRPRVRYVIESVFV